jgi:prepilin signal peptidase PulO-like enzyme (type II secretory pathway)
MSQYILCLLITLFIILIDCIVTYINSRVYSNYYVIELLPWNRIIYKKINNIFALILSVVANISILFIFFIIPIQITFSVMYMGIMIYRLINSIVRFMQYWRVKDGREKE